MDLKAHYLKIRELERGFGSAYLVVVSLETADGGKAGLRTEVPAAVAAKMIVEGRALAASEQETKEFHAQQAEAKRQVDSRDASKRMQVTVAKEKR